MLRFSADCALFFQNGLLEVNGKLEDGLSDSFSELERERMMKHTSEGEQDC